MTRKCEGCNKEAEWVAYFLHGLYGSFGRKAYYCGVCLLDDLNGVHSGGGPFLECFLKVKRLHPGRIKPSDIYFGVKKEEDKWKIWWMEKMRYLVRSVWWRLRWSGKKLVRTR